MANTLSYNTSAWARHLQDSLYGFNTDPRSNRIDEYERYNTLRLERYAREDEAYQRFMYHLAGSFIALAGILIFLIK